MMDDQARNPSKTTVLIVGGGPTGILMAFLLGKYGYQSIILERQPKRSGQPKAHVVNPRSLEILRQAGFDTTELREQGQKVNIRGDGVKFVLSITGLELGSLPFESQPQLMDSWTPEPLLNCAQPFLEGWMEGPLAEQGKSQTLRNCQWETVTRAPDGKMTSKVLDRGTGKYFDIESKYLIGCDGSHSRSRGILAIPFSTLDNRPPAPIHYCTAHFNADLSMYPASTLWFVMSARTLQIAICYDPKGDWVMIMNYDPAVTPASTFSQEYCRERIDEIIGAKVNYDILSIKLWNTSPMIADHYRSREFPNAFLAGDAAHAFPNTGGLGLNTGFADAQNLAWKIHAAESGWAGPSLLNSYGIERRPVAEVNTRQSAKNELDVHHLIKAVSELGAGASDLNERFSRPDIQHELTVALADHKDHFDSINLQLGYIYGSKDVENRAPSDFNQECVPGSRLPHAWVMYNGKKTSTLDLVALDTLTLLVTEDFENTPVFFTIGKVPINIKRAGVNFIVSDEEWLDIMGFKIVKHGVLVRPDHHIVGVINDIAGVESLIIKAFLRE